jgi:Cysteine-rich CPCC
MIFACPCCYCLTLDESPPGTFLCCPVCWWEDDPIQFADPDYRGGANQPSLNEARENFRQQQVSDPSLRHLARPPHPQELPKNDVC